MPRSRREFLPGAPPPKFLPPTKVRSCHPERSEGPQITTTVMLSEGACPSRNTPALPGHPTQPKGISTRCPATQVPAPTKVRSCHSERGEGPAVLRVPTHFPQGSRRLALSPAPRHHSDVALARRDADKSVRRQQS